MVRVTEELALAPDNVSLYYANDPLLGHLPVLVFHGASTTANYTHNSSRIQIHVFSPAGYQSYPRLTVQPNSPFYSVVGHLPREFQGDETWRGISFGLFKYFAELPDAVKNHLKKQYPAARGHRPGSAPTLFSEQHAADLAKAMVKSDNTAEVIKSLSCALQTQHISNVDIDLVLPPGAIIPLNNRELEEVPDDEDDILDPTLRQYGMYTPLVRQWGEPVFLPTSKLRRAPSKPTSLNKGKAFSKDQREDLRMKLSELVETEERYVAKVEDLVKNLAEDFRSCAKTRSSDSISPTEEEVAKLFPKSADSILELNSAFMHELKKALQETDDDMSGAIVRMGTSAKAKDPSGALSVARLFVEWFPKFTDSYQDYIRASQNFPALLNSFLDKQSSFRQRVAQTGEQTIRSALIEPVQRLPRYSLLIDQIVACLPITHPALQLMLRARDIITNICSMDEPLVDKPHVANRLRNMVECWPLDLEPQGRLILAIDYAELAPPFKPDASLLGGLDAPGILLLFSDCVVLVNKKSHASSTGKELVREIDRPSAAGLLASMTNAAGGPGSYDLLFTGWQHLADVRFTESVDGRLLWMTSTQEMRGAYTGALGVGKGVTSRCLVLQEGFEAKAGKLSEEIVKARVEARFSEAERETPVWTLRTARMPDNNLGIHAAVFSEAAEQLVEGRREPAPIRIVIDNDRGTKGHPVGHYGVEIVTEVRSGDLKRIRMSTLGLNGKQYSDDVALEDFIPTLSRRIIQLLSSQNNVANLRLVPALVSYYSHIARNLAFNARAEKTRSFLSSSPVKMLSTFLGASSPEIASSSPPKGQRGALLSAPALIARPAAGSKESLVDSIKSRHSRDGFPIDQEGDDRPDNPLVRLEHTFTGYVACLQYRKGQFIGRLLLNRSMVDELAVNDLYNQMMESPYDLESSADVASETVFVAFEKFVRIAWQEQMGAVMSAKHLDLLLQRAGRKVPGEFGDFVRYLFNEMAPQNRRAFTALIKLLADLLEGCGNDSDRGALTLAFAQLLVDESDAPMYMNLLDRLVDDADRIFEDPLAALAASFERASAYNESVNSTVRSHKSATGSFTSNASSLRKKWGLDSLLRTNSKGEKSDSERSSVWRTLSKHARNPATGESLSMSRAAISRSKSIDIGVVTMPNKLRRPASHDRPRVAGAFDDLRGRPMSVHRPASSHRLETIGEPSMGDPEIEVMEPPQLGLHKRRSSLSDLRSLLDNVALKADTPATLPPLPLPPTPEPPPLVAVDKDISPAASPLPLKIAKQTSEKVNGSPRVPASSKIPKTSPRSSPQLVAMSTPSPSKKTSMLAQPSPSKLSTTGLSSPSKMNTIGPSSPSKMSKLPMTPVSQSMRSPRPRTATKGEPLQSMFLTPQPSMPAMGSLSVRKKHAKTISTSNIPSLKPSRLPMTGGSTPMTGGSTPMPAEFSRSAGPNIGRSPTQRLRLQSPQKLRERLQTEKRAAEDVDSSLKSELSRISEDMARVNSHMPRSNTQDLRKVSASVKALEERIPVVLQELDERHRAMQEDMEASLQASEAKVRAIDQLYKEATAENELFYEKFNTELGRIVKAIRGKGRDDREELLAKLKDQSEEVAFVKKENARLRRETVSLRSLLKGGGPSGHGNGSKESLV